MKKTILAFILTVGLVVVVPVPAQANEFLDRSKAEQEINNRYTLSINAASDYHSKNVLSIQNNYNSNLQNIKNTAGVKETQSIVDYQNAMLKWKEVDQVKIVKNIDIKKDTGCQPSVVDRYGVAQSKDCVVDINILQSRSSNKVNSLIRLSTQDGGSRDLGPTGAVVGPIISGQANDGRYGAFGIPGGDNVIYQLVAGWPEWEKPNWIDFNWDFEWEYSAAGLKWEVPAKTILSFDVGWIYPVKLDGTRIPYSEFSAARNKVKTSYANMLSAQADHKKLIASANDQYSKQLSNAEAYKRSLIEDAQKVKFDAESSIAWVDKTNQTLKEYFPDKVKSDLMKKGYFKPLKTFYWTCSTGRYVASAEWLDQYTVAVGGYWETKTCKDVPTKKEQKTWMKQSEAKLAASTNHYNKIIEQAKSQGYKVNCKAKNPCKISYKKD